jgi:hypothetical protein
MIVAINPEHPMIRASQGEQQAPSAPEPRAAAPAPVPAPVAQPAAKLVGTDELKAATAAAGAQAMAHPTWRVRLERARDDRETLRVLAQMSLTLGHPARSMDLYGALLSADQADSDALEGVVLSHIRCGQHAAAARVLASIQGA